MFLSENPSEKTLLYIMSWSEYVSGSSGLMAHYDKISAGGIFGHNGSTWAQQGMDHTTTYYNEITAIVELFTNPKEAYSKVSVALTLVSKNAGVLFLNQ